MNIDISNFRITKAAVLGILSMPVLASASPVVVTPGANAGYLYFSPVTQSSASGGGGTTKTDCANVSDIGTECEWSDGVKTKLVAKNVGSFSKVFAHVDVGAATEQNLNGCTSSQRPVNSDGISNTSIIKSCSIVALTCSERGSGFFLPSIQELSAIWANKAVHGFNGNYHSSSITQSGFTYYANALVNGAVFQYNYSTTGTYAYICTRKI